MAVKVWRPDGVLAWTNRAQDRIGKRFEEEGELEEALHGATAGSIGGLGEDAYEIYADPADLEQALASRRHVIWGAVALVFLVLWRRWRSSSAEPRAPSAARPAS